MKTVTIISALFLTLSNLSYAGTQNCDANSACTFSIPVNTLITVSLDNIQKDHLYKCSIDGLARVDSVDRDAARKIGLKDVDFKPINIFHTEFTFNSKKLNVPTGNLYFNLVSRQGD